MWAPMPEGIEQANMTAFCHQAAADWQAELKDYGSLYQWSIDNPEQFWVSVWNYAKVIGDRGTTVLVDGDRMLDARWFPEAKLNFAENLLRRHDDGDALVFWGEDRIKRRISHAQLYEKVSRTAKALKALGVVTGDRVAGYMPNIPETVVAMLAVTSIGAVWSSCSPDFGARSALDRFAQIEPKVLFTANGYFYNGKTHDSLAQISEITTQLPSVQRVLVVPYTEENPSLPEELTKGILWADFIAPFEAGEINFTRVPFNHPLYIMFSSGTTGVPKCIVHSVGGTLLQHLKEHLLHLDIKPNERLFYFTTCSWMMWNWFVTGLGAGATLMLYDGSPFYCSGSILFDYAQAEGINVFGTSAKYIDTAQKQGLQPAKTHELQALRTILSTGSPLLPENFDYVYSAIKPDVCLSSISGGTDILSCFALGNPVLPVWRGELQCRGLGLAVDVFDDSGQSIQQEKGELVCTKPFPSMPIGFWNDPDGTQYHATYFDRFDNVWCQGDYAELTAHDGLIIHGRSDAVLNPGGVRIGTAEIYRQIAQLDEVIESVVIGQDWEGDVRVVLFVILRAGLVMDDVLIEKIRQNIRANTTPRHVPAKIIQVSDIPRTRSGKLVEVAVRQAVHGDEVKNMGELVNPEALKCYRDLAELQF